MEKEVIYADGSMSTFHEGGGSSHAGDYAMLRFQLITLMSAINVELRTKGQMRLSRNPAGAAIKNVLEPITGKTYKRSMKGKQEALDDCEALLYQIEHVAVVYNATEGE